MKRRKCVVGGSSSATEATLFIQAQSGCRDSVNRLMARHDGLVQAVVRRQVLGALPFSEGLQAGRIGLWHAVLGYDPTHGTRFSTYAWTCIMRQVWRAVKQYDGNVSTALPVALDSVRVQTLEPAVSGENQAVGLALCALLQRLPTRLRRVIVARYGLDGSSPLSYRQLGAFLGLSHERARQLHIEALVWLRHPAHSQTLRSLLHRHTLADYECADALAQRWLRRRGGRHVR